jgi:hypothetical protein
VASREPRLRLERAVELGKAFVELLAAVAAARRVVGVAEPVVERCSQSRPSARSAGSAGQRAGSG